MAVERLVKRALRRLGYDLTEYRYRSSYISGICKPRTVIDVGVGHGTYALYDAFPDARFVLFEPLREFEPSIRKISRRVDCVVHYNAVGSREGRLEINIQDDNLERSSLMDRTALSSGAGSVQKRSVDVVTLDRIYGESPDIIRGPILLKVDTEGYELPVLEGAKNLLKLVDVVIAEVSIARRFKNSYEFEDIVSFMSNNGFGVFSILDIFHIKSEVRPRFADVVFKRR